MRGLEEIEWQDRSWRILENDGEVKTGWVALGAAGGGAIGALFAAWNGKLPLSMGNAMLGGAGVGMASGIPYMIASLASGTRSA